jgi:cytoskeleton protein RodZ
MSKVTHLTLDESGGLNKRRIHLREISGDAETPLGTVGQDLRAARLRLGDDLSAVSKALKIRKDLLEAIEEDKFEALPGRAYAVGFVRSYADYLGLDALECVERFKLEIAGRGGDDPIANAIPDPGVEEKRLPQGWIVIAVFVAGLFIFGIYRLATSSESASTQAVAPVPTQLVTGKPHVATTKPKSVKPATQVVVQAPSGAVPPAISTAQPAAKNAQTPTVPALPKGKIYGAQNRDARVVLRILSPVKILVQGTHGRTFINRALQPGDTYNVPLVNGVTLTTSNGAAVELELDGQTMGNASKSQGTIEAMPLDPQTVADHGNAG